MVGLDFVVITPSHRGIEPETVQSMANAYLLLMLEGYRFHWIVQPGDALISRARSLACTRFLSSEYAPYMVFLDSDIVFLPEDLTQIYKALKDGHDLVGGLYVTRGGQKMAHYNRNGKWKLDGGIHAVEYLSTGFMGISRRLLIKMRDELNLPLLHPKDEGLACYPFFEAGAHNYKENLIFRSEDWDFCDKARKVGVVPMAHTGVQLGHVGYKVWSIDDMAGKFTKIKKAAGTNSPA